MAASPGSCRSLVKNNPALSQPSSPPTTSPLPLANWRLARRSRAITVRSSDHQLGPADSAAAAAELSPIPPAGLPDFDPEWTSTELAALVRGTRLQTTFGTAEVIEYRAADDMLSVQLPFGRASLRRDALRQRPSRFSVNEKVTTPLGNGVVTRVRATHSHVSYVVNLVDWVLATGKPAVAYLGAAVLKPRSILSVTELFATAERAKLAGNELFRDGHFTQALQLYSECIDYACRARRLPLAPAQDRTYVEYVVKSYSNVAQCFLKLDEPARAKSAADEAMLMDPSDQLGMRNKLLHRRATALMAMGEYRGAIKDLEMLPRQASTTELLKKAQEEERKSEKQTAKMWSHALARSKAEGGLPRTKSARTMIPSSPTSPDVAGALARDPSFAGWVKGEVDDERDAELARRVSAGELGVDRVGGPPVALPAASSRSPSSASTPAASSSSSSSSSSSTKADPTSLNAEGAEEVGEEQHGFFGSLKSLGRGATVAVGVVAAGALALAAAALLRRSRD